jgi:hypothetical protein
MKEASTRSFYEKLPSEASMKKASMRSFHEKLP